MDLFITEWVTLSKESKQEDLKSCSEGAGMSLISAYFKKKIKGIRRKSFIAHPGRKSQTNHCLHLVTSNQLIQCHQNNKYVLEPIKCELRNDRNDKSSFFHFAKVNPREPESPRLFRQI